MKKLTHHQKVQLAEAVCFAVTFLGLFLYFDVKLFLISLVLGWFVHGIGLSVTLHRLCTHRAFTPRNRLIKLFLLFVATISTLGSPIAWAITHITHHKNVDTPLDPTYPKGTVWHTVKSFFSYFHTVPLDKCCIKGLCSDKDYFFFHRHYFKILLAYVVLLGLINPLYIIYVYAIPVVFSVICIGWVSTLAHLPGLSVFGYRNHNTNDNTYNSLFWQLITWGEGLHNNHHAKAFAKSTAEKWFEFDLTYLFIRLVNKRDSHEY
jgi:stearoyl-CoA desaturase (delta-9 desaturase)